MIKTIIKSALPENLVIKLSEIKNKYFGGYAIKSYSQEGEDMILRRIFEDQKTGFYVDVGAYHPKRFSNTYFFYKKGWRGMNIDAMPGCMSAFNKIRSRDINIEKPVSDKNQILTYYAFNDSALNGFSKAISEQRHGVATYFVKFTKKMDTSTLEEILDHYLPKDQTIDFLTVDVEGLDFEVLKSINFEKYRPRIILVEMLGANFSDLNNNDMVQYLGRYRYRIFAKTVNTVFFIHEKISV